MNVNIWGGMFKEEMKNNLHPCEKEQGEKEKNFALKLK